MEYFWYVVAALGAGVGTGLAGLSAATVMVPILLVLCPSFSGETGAYQTTAIALASDILGSAVTTSIYIRHKNIDLRHGWIMLVCIVSMCVAGSVAAWQAGNVVLGTFSLFLTFCIGIRFLVKPDTQRKETIAKEAKLGAKGTAISLFFGLTIGFGTGGVLTVLGAAVLILHYWETLSAVPYVEQILACLGGYAAYLICVVSILLIVRFTLRPDREIFRKLLHGVAFSSPVAFVLCAETWVAASATSLLFAAAVTALCGAYTELISHNGNDTVSVPVVNTLVLTLLLCVF